MGWGGGWLMMVAWLLLLAAALWIAWTIARRGGSASGPGPRPDGAEILVRERFARGEIDEATYRRLLEELRRP